MVVGLISIKKTQNMKMKKISTVVGCVIAASILSTGCRHHREVVYVNNTPPPTTVVYNNTPPPVVNNGAVYVQQQAIAPVVSINYPATNFTSAGNYITVRGNIQYIQFANQVSVSQNGYPIKYFAYDPYTGNFHFQTFLQQGTNNIVVTANSTYGTGSNGVTVFFNPVVPNGGGYPNNNYNPNAGIAPNGGGNTYNPNAAIAPNGGGNVYNPNAAIAPNGGNTYNPNAAIAPNGGGNTYNPNAAIAPNGGGHNPNTNGGGGYNPNANGGGGYNPNANGGNNNNPNGGNVNPTIVNPNGGAINPTQYQNNPVVQYVIPSTSPVDATTSSYQVSATVLNITNPNQITVSVNGANLPNFNFNPSTHSLTFTASNLLTGFNSIHVSATNSIGRTASQSTVIDYKPGVSAPPRIQIFNPATSPFSSLQANMIVSGYVYNVTSSSEITATFNGSPISFNYNSNTQEIDIPVNISGSTNQLVIKANNPAGNDSRQVNLLLVSKNCGPVNPTVNLQTGGVIQPTGNNTNNTPHVGQPNPNLQTGGVTYIDQTNTNNTPHLGQSNPNVQTGGVTYIDQTNTNNTPHVGQQNTSLQTGGVTYIDQHNGTNAGGTTANGMAGVHNKPEITRTSPSSSPFTTMSGVISVAANVNGVTNASEVSVMYNGSSVSFSYNPQVSEALNFTSPLSPGMNTFAINATNSLGTSTQDISVNYVPTNTSGNANGNPNLHFTGGTNLASNTPRELNTNNTPQRTEPVKINTTPKPVIGNEKVEPKKK